MVYDFGLRVSCEASVQAEELKAKVLRCLRRLTRRAGAIPRCCKFIKRSRATALISPPNFLRGKEEKRLIAPGQLKSLGTDAFIAFNSDVDV